MPSRKSTTSLASPAVPTSSTNASNLTLSTSSSTAATATDSKPTSAPKGARQSTSGDGVEGGGGTMGGEKVEKSEKRKSTSKQEEIGIDDLLLPRTLTSRLSRGTLPPNTSIQRDALLALAKSATVFVSYLAHTANGLTSRKTIQSQDILDALKETELWNVPLPGGGWKGATLGERVRMEVEKWEGEVKGKRKGYRARVKARDGPGNEVEGAGDDGQSKEIADHEGEEQTTSYRKGASGIREEKEGRGPPQAKRARRSGVVVDESAMDVDEEESEDASALQLRGEDVAAVDGHGMDSDAEVGEEEDEEEDDVEEEEIEEEDDDDDDDDDEEEVEEENDEDVDNDDEEETDTQTSRSRQGAARAQKDEEDLEIIDADVEEQRRRPTLAPNGRVEVDTDDESD